MLPRRLLAAVLSAPLLLTTACGEAERAMPNTEVAKAVSLSPVQPTIGSSPPVATSAAPTTAASPGATAGASASKPAGNPNEVLATIASKFEPAKLEVKAGTEVTFTNEGGLHTVTGGTDKLDPTSPIGDHILDTAGKSAKIKFDKPGTYDYFCTPHLLVGMKGQVVVT